MTAGIKANSDGSAAIQVGGSDAITITSGLAVSINGGVVYPLVSGTSQTAPFTAPNTYADFTGIPSTAKRIIVMFNGVSLSGTSSILIQLGDSGGIENTGYVSYAGETPTISSTAGFVCYLGNASRALSGLYIITNISANGWVGSSAFSNANNALAGAGSKTLSDTLTQLRITTVNGLDTFDAGTVNILWE